MFFVDANIFLEVELGQEKANECHEILKSIAEGKQATTTDFLLYAVILAMIKNKKSLSDVKKFVGLLYELDSLIIYRPNTANIYDALEIIENEKMDFDDALVYACMKHLKINKIATLDKDFKKFPVEIIP